MYWSHFSFILMTYSFCFWSYLCSLCDHAQLSLQNNIDFWKWQLVKFRLSEVRVECVSSTILIKINISVENSIWESLCIVFVDREGLLVIQLFPHNCLKITCHQISSIFYRNLKWVVYGVVFFLPIYLM